MKTSFFIRLAVLPVFICFVAAIFTGCGAPATSTATAPAITVSSFDLAKAFEADAAKAGSDYASKTLRITDLLAEDFWEMETGNYLKCAPYNATTNEGNLGSDSFIGDKKITQVVVAYPFQFNVTDQKILEPLTLSKKVTADGQTKTIYTDKVEIDCELSSFVDDVLSFKIIQINKK